MDHSSSDGLWWVMRSKVKLGCASTIPAGHEIESQVVFSAIDAVPYFEVWFFILLNLI